MPQRPRSHVLEEESDRAFRTALPAEWTSQKVDDDYGIDWHVEIFEEGKAAGRSFQAQLKGTDEPDLAKALGSVRFRRDTAEYYRDQRLPVLIVCNHAPTGRLFARWFHAYNPRVARAGLKPDAKTVGFQLYEQDEVGSDFADRLRAGLEGFLKFRSPELPLPLDVAVAPTRAGASPDAHRAALALRRVLAPVKDLVTVQVRAPAPDDPSITLESERATVSLADVASVTLDRPEPGEADEDHNAADLLIALAVALTYVGQANVAAQIAAAVGPLGTIVADLEVTSTIAGAMFRSQRVREAIELADALDASEDEDIRLGSFFLLMVLLARQARLQDDERVLALEAAQRRIARRRDRGDGDGAAAEAYNLAMLHKDSAQGVDAVRFFEEAASWDPSYLERAYYHGDFAGALFETGRYADAAEQYARAIELGGQPIDRALYGDSLLHLGRYEQAGSQFDAYVSGGPGRDAAEWRLKAQAIPLLIHAVGVEQDRRLSAAEDILAAWNFQEGPEMSPEDAAKSCWEALTHDACCAEAWFRLGLLTIVETDDPVQGARQSVAAAVLGRYSLSYWHNAVLCLDPQDTAAVSDVFYAGYRLNGAPFVDVILEAVNAAPHLADQRERLIALLDQTVTAYELDQANAGGVLRFKGEDGTMREIAFSEGDDELARHAGPSKVTWQPPPAHGPGSKLKHPRRKKPGKTYGKKKKRKRR